LAKESEYIRYTNADAGACVCVCGVLTQAMRASILTTFDGMSPADTPVARTVNCVQYVVVNFSTSGLKSDVTIVFLGPDFLENETISAIRVYLRQADVGLSNICMGFQPFQDLLA